eukprot:scaffold418_cov386-Prasinococcus_capsulatus_cf.AAC.13
MAQPSVGPPTAPRRTARAALIWDCPCCCRTQRPDAGLWWWPRTRAAASGPSAMKHALRALLQGSLHSDEGTAVRGVGRAHR